MSTKIINFFRVNIDQSNNKIVSFNDKNNIQNIKKYIISEEWIIISFKNTKFSDQNHLFNDDLSAI